MWQVVSRETKLSYLRQPLFSKARHNTQVFYAAIERLKEAM